MPTFDFTAPDGRSYIVNGPDGATPQQAFQLLQQHLGSAQPAEPSVGMGEDAAKSVGAGLGQAAISTLGMGGDMRELASKGLDFAGSKLGFDPSGIKSAASMASKVIPGLGLMANAPTSADIKSTVTDPIVSPDYQPQYETGRLLKKGAEFAPNMLLGGPEGLGARFLTNVAAPAIGSEIGGKVAGPIGEVAGGIIGAGGATAAARKFQAMAAARNGANAVPTGEELVKAGSKQFDAARDMDVVVKPDFAAKTASDMRAALKDFDPQDASVKDVFRKIDRLDNMAQTGAVEMNEIENVRKQLSKLRKSADPSTREAAKTAQVVLTENQAKLAASDVLFGDAPLYSQTIKNAVGNYGAGKRSLTVMGKQDLAELNAGTAGSGANEDNAMRQAIKQLARPISNTNVPVAKKLGFNNQEVDAIKRVAMGTPFGNTARYLGKLAPTGSVSGVLSAGAGYGAAGPFGAVALPAAGYLAKKIGDMSTKSAIKTLDSLVRSRSPLAQQVAAQLPPQLVAQLPAKTQGALQALATQPVAQQQRPVAPLPQPLTPQRPIAIPPTTAPIFTPAKPPARATVAQPAPTPEITAAGDGQQTRPSAAQFGDNARLRKYQDWSPGRIVKVGFVDGLKVEGVGRPPYPGDSAPFILTKGDKVYRVMPHRGMEKLSAAEGKQALREARNPGGS